jgi:hypothetical protein
MAETGISRGIIFTLSSRLLVDATAAQPNVSVQRPAKAGRSPPERARCNRWLN